MSSGVAVLAGDRPYGGRTWSRGRQQPVRGRPLVRVCAFAALALYGAMRWATLMQPAPWWRLFGEAGLAIALAAAGALLYHHSRLVMIGLALLSVPAMLAIAGIPLHWLWHERIAVTARGINEGLQVMPGVLVPYLGINPWVRIVLVLGAAVLLLDAGLLLAFAPRTMGELRRAGAALPLIALAIVPATLDRPQLPYLQGLLLFVLIAAFLWGERISRQKLAAAIGLACVVGGGAAIAAARIDPHQAWVNPHGLAGDLSPTAVDKFDWAQTYGPLRWPRDHREVLDVNAPRRDYWKAENLDLFNGTAWTIGVSQQAPGEIQPTAAQNANWTQTLEVTVRDMNTTDIIAAGTASQPQSVGEGVVPGDSAGVWIAGAALGPGSTYTVQTYSPQPTSAELAAAGPVPSGGSNAYLTIELPPTPSTPTIGNPPEVQFPPFHSGVPEQSVIGTYGSDAATLVRASYGGAFVLARRLARRAATPYAFVKSVMRYLAHGFTYDEAPPASALPLESFLFGVKRGYCQQFAGAMALLLRMGGVPARVAVGFAPGKYDSANHEYRVTDEDAHAWVEAWFAPYGWVRFDPTPPAAPALGGNGVNASLTKSQIAPGRGGSLPGSHGLGNNAAGAQGSSRNQSSSLGVVLLVGLLLLAALGASAAYVRRAMRPQSIEQLLAELERALKRSGRPLGAGTTLAVLEQRFRSSGDAAGYIRALRLARFADAQAVPSAAQRRALRTALRHGLGPLGWVRGWWALPPRHPVETARSRTYTGADG